MPIATPLILYRRDFRICQDGSGDSLFDDVLAQLGILGGEEIDAAEIIVDSFSTD